ncbi:hypothetical protein SNEBB_009457 [Seison nebaliae]|nr:hypothetical protein SNEBB_009457 [Seison nebaliae]
MSTIKKVHSRYIYDSRGNPTIEVDVTTDRGIFRAGVPSGASTGVHEALEMRDGDKNVHHGKGVLNAMNNVNNVIGPQLINAKIAVDKQKEIDDFMLKLDGTKNKSKLGANAILGVSIACCKAAAAFKGIPVYRHIADLAKNKDVRMPVPCFNVINGGSHAGNRLPMQEFMVLPTGAKNFTQAMQMGSETYHHLKKVIKDTYGQDACNVGDEGGFAPNILGHIEALDLLMKAIDKAGYTGKMKIAMDVAASEFFEDGKYNLDNKAPKKDPSKIVSSDEMIKLYKEMIAKYPIVSIEDAFDQDDWNSWSALQKDMSIQLVGDDLTVTNVDRMKTAIDKKACNCLLLKVNQIGSISESIAAYQLAKANKWGVMVSHRSGETEDAFIADLVVGLNTGQIKTGAPCRSERVCKYNQLKRIEEELGSSVQYAGDGFTKL